VVFQIIASPSGGLWVFYNKGNLDLVRGGHVTHFRDTQKKFYMSGLFKGPDGFVWSISQRKAFVRFDGTRWSAVPGAPAPENVRGVTSGSKGDLWMVGEVQGDVYRRQKDETAFRKMGVQVPGAFSVSAPADNILFVSSLSRQVYRFRVVGDNLVACGPPLSGLAAVVSPDTHGGGWMATAGDGLHYFPSLDSLCPASPQMRRDDVYVAKKDTGATGDTVMTALVDREGNTWATSENGLDRYSRSAFSKVRFPVSIDMATIAGDTDGSLWVGNEGSDVFHYTDGLAASGGVAPSALALSRSADGTVLAASTTGVWSLGQGASKLLAPLPGALKSDYPAALHVAPSPAADPRLWLAYNGNVFVLHAHEWVRQEGIGKTFAIYGTGDGTTWLLGATPDVVLGDAGDGRRTWTKADGLSVGRPKVVTDGPGGIWFAGDEGIQLLAAGRFRTLTTTGQVAVRHITGVVFDRAGTLWIHSAEGLYRIGAEDIAQFLRGKTDSLPAVLYTLKDGLPGQPTQLRSLPSLVAGSDGRIWLQGNTAVSWFDPADFPATAMPSPPFITGMAVGAHRFDTAAPALALSRSERSPRFSYTAPATTDASVVRYQTRLTGFDDGWTDQGGRHEVSYPRISAGQYVFSVRASTDGVTWTSDPPQIAFSVAPYFYETWWFKLGSIVAGLLMVWVVAHWQIRRTVQRYQARTRMRTEEREAVARDIHDTLLQSNLALVLQLEAAVLQTPDAAARARLVAIAEGANQAMSEGRLKISALRAGVDAAQSLCGRLKELGEDLSAETGARFVLVVEKRARPLQTEPAETLRLLLSEAITNAFRHANAAVVRVTLSFGRWQLHAAVEDDGEGLPPDVAETGRREGHWGLQGMGERAKSLHGRFGVDAVVPNGTRVWVTMAGRWVYATPGVSKLLTKGFQEDDPAGP
jgi:signal transduction histidine kinase